MIVSSLVDCENDTSFRVVRLCGFDRDSGVEGLIPGPDSSNCF